MRRFSDRHALQTLSELNITPLLDLAFVLLIIFMITTPLMESSMDLVLPSSDAAQHSVDPNAVQSVSIDQNEEISINDQKTDLATLEGQLTALKERNPDVAVVVRAHKTLPVQKMMNVMDAVQRARIKKVGIVTIPEQP
ncbi:MAG TPA: biopolymer transporter ExbD [Chthoniobacteraceae bacterium]|jgi:biopolymer transport protein ExbD|nr:biopolymer transporter ExbD [Chthoniobacteraceae bacterium]